MVGMVTSVGETRGVGVGTGRSDGVSVRLLPAFESIDQQPAKTRIAKNARNLIERIIS